VKLIESNAIITHNKKEVEFISVKTRERYIILRGRISIIKTVINKNYYLLLKELLLKIYYKKEII